MAKRSHFIRQSVLPYSVEAVFAWHKRPGAFERLNAPWRPVEIVSASHQGIEKDSSVSIRVPVLKGIGVSWDLRHVDVKENELFVDEQVRGPFIVWRHEHRFERESAASTRLVDSIEFTLPIAARILKPLFIMELERLFSYRHRVLERDLTLHQRFVDRPRKTILISGASGFIGSSLRAFLSTAGHTVKTLVRHQPTGPSERYWDPYKGELEPGVFEGVDVVIHLSGENIASGRWSARRKELILKSREVPTKLITETMRKLSRPPELSIIASGVGFYGASREWKDESAPRGDGFLASVSAAWEESARSLVEDGRCRVVFLRMGTVLNARGGALAKMLPAFLAGLGGPLGDGDQWMSWIALQDLLGLIEHSIYTPDIIGPLNAVSPYPCSNKEFTQALANVLRRPAFCKLPRVVIKTLFGEMGETLLLANSRVAPSKAESSGYKFLFPDIESALRFEVGG